MRSDGFSNSRKSEPRKKKMADRRAMAASSNDRVASAAQQRHDQLMRVYRETQAHEHASSRPNNYVATHDMEVLQRNFQFIRDDEADLERGERDWEVRMSVRYYRKLFREYALADLSRYKEGKVGLRWRTEMEVVAGKGQFVCGNKICDARRALHSYELLFAYMEHGEKKRCLVKVRVCEACARKLFYRKLKEAEKKMEKKDKEKRRSRGASDDEDTDSSSSRHKRNKKHKRSRTSSENDEHGERNTIQKEEKKVETKKISRKESIHARCAAINATETHGLGRAEDGKGKSTDDKETQELARLLL